MAARDDSDADSTDGVDPVEFIRRALQISPEDAAAVREDAARAEKRGPAGCRTSHGSGNYCELPLGHVEPHEVKISGKRVPFTDNGTG